MSSTRLPHKNKTAATLLALLLGGVGAHRFYLRGGVDKLGLLHLCSLPLAGLVIGTAPGADIFYKVLPILLSYIVGFIEALVIGLLSDEKFDARYNAGSGRQSDSHWPLALILVATMMVGTTTMIATISRLFDLLYTGGAYG
jgi:TM2 domain-containing membrane protein YozV